MHFCQHLQISFVIIVIATIFTEISGVKLPKKLRWLFKPIRKRIAQTLSIEKKQPYAFLGYHYGQRELLNASDRYSERFAHNKNLLPSVDDRKCKTIAQSKRDEFADHKGKQIMAEGSTRMDERNLLVNSTSSDVIQTEAGIFCRF